MKELIAKPTPRTFKLSNTKVKARTKLFKAKTNDL